MKQIINQSLILYQSQYNNVGIILHRFLKDFNMKRAMRITSHTGE